VTLLSETHLKPHKRLYVVVYSAKWRISITCYSGRESQGAWRQDELIDGKPPVIKSLWLSLTMDNVRKLSDCTCKICYLRMLVITRLYNVDCRMDDEYGSVGGMRTGKIDRSTRKNSATVPFYTPQIPHDLAWDRTRTTAAGSWQLTTWAIAQLQSKSRII
jgi:hypothetical protein